MTNYELICSTSKEELAVLLAQITTDANDYTKYIKDIYKWLDSEAKCHSKNTDPKEGLEIITTRYFRNNNISKPEGEQDNG